MKKKNSNILWGITLIVVAVILILSQLGFLGGTKIDVWTLLLSAFLVIILIKSIIHLSFSGILFPLAFLCILYDDILGISALTPWTVLIVALLGSIGLSMIFKPHKKHSSFCSISGDDNWQFSEVIDDADGDVVTCSTNFGSCIKYINSDNLVKAYVNASFGGVKVYFDKALIQGEYAQVCIDGSFCGIELFIPKEWTITNQVDIALAGINEKNPHQHIGGGSHLVLTGNLKFSGIEIIYI